jgi:hypothetical protein
MSNFAAEPNYWNSYLATTVAFSLKHDKREAREMLRGALQEFLRSPCATPDLERRIREEMRKR